jgi:hypothetical protein
MKRTSKPKNLPNWLSRNLPDTDEYITIEIPKWVLPMMKESFICLLKVTEPKEYFKKDYDELLEIAYLIQNGFGTGWDFAVQNYDKIAEGKKRA